MIGSAAELASTLLLLQAEPTLAGGDQASAAPANAAVGSDIFYSADADDTVVVRAGINLDLRRRAHDRYAGVRLEKAWFNPLGEGWRGDERIYLRAADHLGAWRWNARVGTDGRTVLGAASIHDEAEFRKEVFVEREIVETPQGLERGIYYTFGGAALDLPLNERNVVTVLAGLQDFTGDNVRTHLRANFIHVAAPDIGLSLQVRGRYFRNSHPQEYDYYSPRWYAQLLPVIQLRRFSGGWRYLVAGGVGAQRDSESDWRRSTYFNAQVTSPPTRNWSLTGSLLFSETPTVAGGGYNYLQFTFGVTRSF